jgi:signal transduction histidine kinase
MPHTIADRQVRAANCAAARLDRNFEKPREQPNQAHRPPPAATAPASALSHSLDFQRGRRDPARASNLPETLLAIAGHDLRQPLQIITSAHDVLARFLHDEEQREELARAEDATSRLAVMLAQLVEALQLHQLPRDRRSEPVLLRDVFEDLAGEFAAAARSKNVALTMASSRAVVFSHPILLSGMLRNLLRNAIDHTPSGGRVTVGCRRCGSELRIDVRDTGVGIRPEALERISRHSSAPMTLDLTVSVSDSLSSSAPRVCLAIVSKSVRRRAAVPASPW